MEVSGIDYRRRLTLALAGSVAFHLLTVTYVAVAPADHRTGGGPIQRPIVVDLAPQETPAAHVDTAVGTIDEVDPQTDLISDKNAKASDLSDVVGSRPAPYFPEPSDFDESRAPVRGPATPPPGAATPQPQPQGTSEAKAAEQAPAAEQPPAPEQPEEAARTPQPEEARERQVLKALGKPREAPAKEAPTAPQDEGMQMAKAATAEPGAQTPTQQPGPQQAVAPATPGKLRGRIDGGVKNLGFLGFEAKKNEFAPYLKIVRDRVESRWYRALELKYSGSSKTQAVLDCAIAPDGSLVYVEIVEAGSSATYAHLCKEAIEKAAPFPPFPFEVPAVYRSKNLEIRWTFSFM